MSQCMSWCSMNIDMCRSDSGNESQRSVGECCGWQSLILCKRKRDFGFEPQHDKSNKMTVRPAETFAVITQADQSPVSVGMKKAWVLSCPLSAQQRFWLDWVDAQADLSLHWAHSHFVGFVMLRLICLHVCFVLLPTWQEFQGHCPDLVFLLY